MDTDKLALALYANKPDEWVNELAKSRYEIDIQAVANVLFNSGTVEWKHFIELARNGKQPKMANVFAVQTSDNRWDIRGRDKDGNIWSIVRLSPDGIEQPCYISEDSGWNLDDKGRLVVK